LIPQKDAVFVNLPDISVAGKSMFRPVWAHQSRLCKQGGGQRGWVVKTGTR